MSATILSVTPTETSVLCGKCSHGMHWHQCESFYVTWGTVWPCLCRNDVSRWRPSEIPLSPVEPADCSDAVAAAIVADRAKARVVWG